MTDVFTPTRRSPRRGGKITGADCLSSEMLRNRVVRSMAKALSRVRKRLATSDLLAFNLQNRDRWVAAQAALVPAGSRVLDVGAGSAPYRALFSRCDYKTQDFIRLDETQLRDGGYGEIDFVCDAAAIPV